MGREMTGELLLTRAELELLTSVRQPKRMCRWLTQRGWIYEPPTRSGDIPKVDRGYYQARMSGQQPAFLTAPARPRVRLDFMLQPSR